MTQEEVCTIFSKNLNRLMSRDGLKQSDIVSQLKVSKAQVSDWCAGKNLPRSNYLGALTSLFHCKLSDLVGDAKAPDAPQDDGLADYLEMLRNRPECRMLFSVAKDATKDDVEKAVAIIEALRKTEGNH